MVRQPGLGQILDYREKLAAHVLKCDVSTKKCENRIYSLFSLSSGRQCGQVVRTLDVKSGNPEFRYQSNHQLDLFEEVLG